MPKKIDLTGRKFGRLTVIRFYENRNKQNYWLCRCSCGKEVVWKTAILNYGLVKSCGCMRTEKLVKRSTKHGFASRKNSHPLYNIRAAMINRCNNPNDRYYKDYGERGINVFQQWVDHPKSFVEWGLLNGWEQGLTIDRIDNDNGYFPSNCRFITNQEQSLNRRNTVFLTFNGKSKPLVEWAILFNIKPSTLRARVYNNWSVEKALLTPIKKESGL